MVGRGTTFSVHRISVMVNSTKVLVGTCVIESWYIHQQTNPMNTTQQVQAISIVIVHYCT